MKLPIRVPARTVLIECQGGQMTLQRANWGSVILCTSVVWATSAGLFTDNSAVHSPRPVDVPEINKELKLHVGNPDSIGNNTMGGWQ